MNTDPNATTTVPLSDAPVHDRLRDVVAALVAAGFGVYVFPPERPKVSGERWVIIERDGNVGTVQLAEWHGYKVSFEIKPSRETGSSLAVVLDPGEATERDELTETSDVLAAAAIATGAQYRNFATPKPLPNHGWPHFSWCRAHLVKIVEAGQITGTGAYGGGQCAYVLDGHDTDGTAFHRCTVHGSVEISPDAPCGVA